MNNFIQDIKTNVIDVNTLESFFGILTKGFLFTLNKKLSLRGKPIPHYILNTGDDIMYLEVKGHDMSIEPSEVSNEDFIYSQVPRCIVTPGSITILTDQLTAKSTGTFQVEHDGHLAGIVSDFRRYPIKMTHSLKYYFDSYSDAMIMAQQMIANEAFVNTFEVSYLGQRIFCSYMLPDSEDIQKTIEFDGLTTDSKLRTIELDLEVETNYPVLYPATVMPADGYIKETILGTAINIEAEEFKKGLKINNGTT